jgi:hypothetical protein
MPIDRRRVHELAESAPLRQVEYEPWWGPYLTLHTIMAAQTDEELDRLKPGFNRALRAFRRCLYANKQRHTPGGGPFRDDRLRGAMLNLRGLAMSGILSRDPWRYPERGRMSRKVFDLIHAMGFVEKPEAPLANPHSPI